MSTVVKLPATAGNGEHYAFPFSLMLHMKLFSHEGCRWIINEHTKIDWQFASANCFFNLNVHQKLRFRLSSLETPERASSGALYRLRLLTIVTLAGKWTISAISDPDCSWRSQRNYLSLSTQFLCQTLYMLKKLEFISGMKKSVCRLLL